MSVNRSETFTPLFRKLLSLRGLQDAGQIESFIQADVKDLSDSYQMKGMKEAVHRIRQAVERQEKILIHGDYDVDGITATAILAQTFHQIEVPFSTFLPDRAGDGYGVSEAAIINAKEQGVSLLITADCGITAHKEIRTARSLGMDVIVIDHHRIPSDGLPEATVILNPLQHGCDFPFKELSAGGLAFKLSQALIGNQAYEFLDLATLSTICDVAPLKDENRIIVKKGLECLGQRKNLGLKALAGVSKIKSQNMTVGHVGFMLGPRINAAGRMSTPEIALRLLLTQNQREAESLASALDEENKVRQKEERQVVRQAIQEVERTFHFNRDRVIVVAKEGWHPGVIGIVAARLVEKFYRPAFVIALDKDLGTGSGRSIKGFHLFHALQASESCLIQYGGHEQAAGLKVKAASVESFRKSVNAYAQTIEDPSIFQKKVHFDMEINFGEIRIPFVEELELLEPHGAGNPKPVFLTRGATVKGKPVSLGIDSYQFWVTDEHGTFEAIWRDRSETGKQSLLGPGVKIDLFYTMKLKLWDGRGNLILEVRDFNPQL